MTDTPQDALAALARLVAALNAICEEVTPRALRNNEFTNAMEQAKGILSTREPQHAINDAGGGASAPDASRSGEPSSASPQHAAQQPDPADPTYAVSSGYPKTPIHWSGDQPAGEPDAQIAECDRIIANAERLGGPLLAQGSFAKRCRDAIVGLRAAPAAQVPREPTEGMTAAARRLHPWVSSGSAFREIWQTMYDAATGKGE